MTADCYSKTTFFVNLNLGKRGSRTGGSLCWAQSWLYQPRGRAWRRSARPDAEDLITFFVRLASKIVYNYSIDCYKTPCGVREIRNFEGSQEVKKHLNTILLAAILVCAVVCVVFTGMNYYNGLANANTKEAKDTAVQEKLNKCYEEVRAKTDFEPDIALVLGSGLGDFADNIDVQGEIPYSEIDGFPVSTAPGHEGKFVYGTLGGKKIICMKGRVHLYEGYAASDVVLPIRIMKMMGAKTLILTNAAGGLNTSYQAGDLMLITDHISDFVPNPLVGGNIDDLGTRFPDMGQVYKEDLNNTIRASAQELGITLREGVYIQLSGPSYETPAEVKMCRSLGADAVGMSTVVEAIAANHAGMKVCGISCITNMSSDTHNKVTTEQEVIDAANKASASFTKLLIKSIENMQ